MPDPHPKSAIRFPSTLSLIKAETVGSARQKDAEKPATTRRFRRAVHCRVGLERQFIIGHGVALGQRALSFPPSAFGERGHRGLAGRRVAVGRLTVVVVTVGKRPKPR